MTTIIKQKGEALVCLRTEMEKPKHINFYLGKDQSYTKPYDDALQQWFQSFKEYPIRKEDKMNFKVIAHQAYFNKMRLSDPEVHLDCVTSLSEGIEIDSKLVRIEKIFECCSSEIGTSDLCNRCPNLNNKEYAVLVLPEEESNEDDKELNNAIDTALYFVNFFPHAYEGSSIKRRETLIRELSKFGFTITRKNK